MKTFIWTTLGLAAALAMVSVAGTFSAPAQQAASTDTSPTTVAASPNPPLFAAPNASDNIPSTPPTLPANILPSSPLAQVARLVQAGIDQNIIQSYVTNSTSTFNLDSGKIIYLSDIGTPSGLITLMMQRDQVLQQQMAANQTPPPTPTPAPTAPDSTVDYASNQSAPAPDASDVPSAQQPTAVTVNYFYDTLSPYGSWVNIEGYGQCWRPNAEIYDSAWVPYGTRGHWINSDCGWYWQSDYAWGSTFHYGRWFRDPRFGWCWWPDTVWAPSWVTWRYTDDYCGWAPLPPYTVYSPNVGFLYEGNGISVGYDFGLTPDDFIFVANSHFCDWNPWRFRCRREDTGLVFQSSRVINNLNTRAYHGHNVVFNGGVPPQFFSSHGSPPLRTTPLHDLPSPFSGHAGHSSGYQAGNPANYNGGGAWSHQTGGQNNGSQWNQNANRNSGGQYPAVSNAGYSQNSHFNPPPSSSASYTQTGQSYQYNRAYNNNYGQYPAVNNNYNYSQNSHFNLHPPNSNASYTQPDQPNASQYNRNYYQTTVNAAASYNRVPPQPAYNEPQHSQPDLPTRSFERPAPPQPQPSYNPPPAPSHSAPPQSAPAPSSSGGGHSSNNNQDNHHR